MEVLRDTGCSGVIIKRELMDETDFTGEMGHIMMVDRMFKRASMAKVEQDAPFYVGTVEALCLQDPLFDLIIGNVPAARKSDDPNPEWGVVTAVATRVQVRSGKDPKPLKMKEVKGKMSINKKDLIKMQKKDPTLQKLTLNYSRGVLCTPMLTYSIYFLKQIKLCTKPQERSLE